MSDYKALEEVWDDGILEREAEETDEEREYNAFVKVCYEKYKTDWCSERGYKLADVDEETGFNGECYVCLEEFEEFEFQDAEYMKNLLSEDEYEKWVSYTTDVEPSENICESLESQMFRAAMEQSAIEATQNFKVAYKIQCSGDCIRHFISDGERDCLFFSLQEAEVFCDKERGPYNRLGIELTPVEVRIPIKAKVEQKEHSTYKNMRFVSSDER